MRNLLLLVLAAHAFIAGAAPKIKLKTNNGIWRMSNTWDLNRVPANTDTVVIPSGNVVIIDDHQNLGTSKLIIMVYGTLQFTGNGKLTLDENSAVFVQSGGIVDGNGSSAQKLRIGNQQLTGTELQVAASGSSLLLTATSSGYQPPPAGSGFGSFMVLPVIFTHFTVSAIDKNKIEIKWGTANEINSRYFEIERSYNAAQWTKLTAVTANNSSTSAQYSYTDANVLAGTVYYRIKQVDGDGQFLYTPNRRLIVTEKLTVKIWSAFSKMGIKFSEPVNGPLKVQLMDMSGKIVLEEIFNQPAVQVLFDKKGLKGCYLMVVSNSNDINTTQKVNL